MSGTRTILPWRLCSTWPIIPLSPGWSAKCATTRGVALSCLIQTIRVLTMPVGWAGEKVMKYASPMAHTQIRRCWLSTASSFRVSYTLMTSIGREIDIAMCFSTRRSRHSSRKTKTEHGSVSSWKRRATGRTFLHSHSDYSMHPYPTPAHPSHRLHTALRLLCMSIDQRAKRPRLEEGEEAPRSRQDAERVWMLATHGRTARISQANEEAVRATLSQLCATVQKDHERRLQALDTLPRSDSEQMVRQVLVEERTIAELVRQSAACGDEW